MKVAESSQSRPFLEIQALPWTGSGCLWDVHHTTLQFVPFKDSSATSVPSLCCPAGQEPPGKSVGLLCFVEHTQEAGVGLGWSHVSRVPECPVLLAHPCHGDQAAPHQARPPAPLLWPVALPLAPAHVKTQLQHHFPSAQGSLQPAPCPCMIPLYG